MSQQIRTASGLAADSIFIRFLNLLAQPEGWLALLIVAQLLFWTLLPWLLATSLPLDVVSDGLSWGHEWQWGYYKHPPLPSWTVELFFEAFGDLGPFLLSQVAISATYVLIFLLGREIMPARRAAVGALLLMGVYYFSIPTPEYNHNIAQMPLWAAASLAYCMAWKTGALRWWLVLGVAAGLGLLTKYSTGLLLATMVVHLVVARGSRSALLSVGPYLAIAVCVAIVSPHLVWLYHNGFPTLHYAVARAGTSTGEAGRFLAPMKFFAAQVLDIAPAVLVSAFAGMLVLDIAQARRDENLRLLVWLMLGPPVLTILLSLATGLGVRDMWGAPMWNLTGLVLVQAASARWQTASLPRLKYSLAGLFFVGLFGYALANAIVPQIESKPSRIEWPARELSRSFAAIWHDRTHRPLGIVAGDSWLAGLVAMNVAQRPSVWIDASFIKSPWLTPAQVRREGALVLWRVQEQQAAPPAPLASLPGVRVMGVTTFVWPRTPGAPPLRIGYGIVPPMAGRR